MGGNAGSTGGNTCNGTLPSSLCNTEALVTAVNKTVLCGYADWRMPTQRELFTLVHAGTQNPSIDATYFPNTIGSFFWSGSSFVAFPASAWIVFFYDGSAYAGYAMSNYHVRLVRRGR